MSKTLSFIAYAGIIVGIGFAGISFYSQSHAQRDALQNHANGPSIHQRAKVTVYTTTTCPYCYKAKDLLKEYNIEYVEKDLSNSESRKEYKTKLPNVRSVPQIFIGDEHIGGYSELKDLAETGQLMQKVSQ